MEAEKMRGKGKGERGGEEGIVTPSPHSAMLYLRCSLSRRKGAGRRKS
jgi:hypothetical protein